MSNSVAAGDAETMKLVAQLEHPKGDMRFSALMRLQQLKPEKLASYATEVSQCLNDKDASVSWLAVKTLERLKPIDFEQHISAVASLAKTRHAYVRQTTVEVMDRSAPMASEAVAAKQEASMRSKHEASQVRVWLAKREEEKLAKDNQESKKTTVGLARNEEETDETTEAKKMVPSKEKKQRFKTATGMPSPRERAEEKEKQTKTDNRLALRCAL